LQRYILDNFQGKEVDVYLESVSPEFLFLNGAGQVHTQAEDQVYDMFFVLDCSTSDRFEPFAQMVERAKILFCIDHHISNQGLGDFCKLDPKGQCNQ
jgi:phosphoesterase RecJ-like protein